MPFTSITDAACWNTALTALPGRHILQSWEWGQFKSRWGWSPRYLLDQDAAALVLRRSAAPLPFSILYVPKGPVCNFADAAVADRVLSGLVEVAKRERAIFIKIDPDLDASDRSVLLDRGWRPSAEQIQFRNTMLIDLTRSDENLLAETPDIFWPTPDGDYYLRGGHRLWHAPEAKPRSSKLGLISRSLPWILQLSRLWLSIHPAQIITG